MEYAGVCTGRYTKTTLRSLQFCSLQRNASMLCTFPTGYMFFQSLTISSTFRNIPRSKRFCPISWISPKDWLPSSGCKVWFQETCKKNILWEKPKTKAILTSSVKSQAAFQTTSSNSRALASKGFIALQKGVMEILQQRHVPHQGKFPYNRQSYKENVFWRKRKPSKTEKILETRFTWGGVCSLILFFFWGGGTSCGADMFNIKFSKA